MIRLDMSEFQNSDSTWRLIGQGKSGEQDSLANRIRKQPFSDVLLDEFEKAHPNVWDMFLQVFDDGRLTDSGGALADFRHSIIILTSNLGSRISAQAGPGFSAKAGEFSQEDVLRVVEKTFRPEFINRLDRVVVFNPLSRDIMRSILRKELKLLLNRRGLRTRPWAVEYEDSAIEFLLEKGFTPDLGARPLRRAIEQHLLAPLSLQMVQNQAPGGEQFMFIRSDGEALQVDFENPDANEISELDTPSESLRLAELILSTTTPAGAQAFLTREARFLIERTDGEEWAETKAALLSQMNHEDFWGRNDRFRILDRIELADRIQAAASTLSARIDRLNHQPDDMALVRQIANRAYVLREGIFDFDDERPTQAIIGIRLVSEDLKAPQAEGFLERMIQMYKNWSEARGMQMRDLQADDTSRYAALYSVSGFGSYAILDLESGVHVLEVPNEGNRFNRVRVRVKVAPLNGGASGTRRSTVREATRILDNWNPGPTTVVRRYRQDPTPLVRDSVRGWRTGRLNRVYEGNFDILG
jgi:ATP-dependent Clp protease ATP-binding subunit ClpC